MSAVIEVSPFDERFPVIDWQSELPHELRQLRRSIGSSISALYLRDAHHYPSTLTLCLSISSSSDLHLAFRKLCNSIPETLKDIDDIAGAGMLADGGFVLPPESLASRIEQIHELRAKVDKDYPVAYISAARVGEAADGLWIATQNLFFGVGTAGVPTQFRVEAMPEVEYRKFLIERGVFETSDGALILGDRRRHKLHALATSLYKSTDRALCPLTNAALEDALDLPASRRPQLLVRSERCRQLAACVDSYSAELGGAGRRAIIEGLVSKLMGCGDGIGSDTAAVLRAACQ